MLSKVLIFLVRVYQVLLSPLFGACCRFEPCCSQYCIEAVQTHGCARGIYLSVRRLLKCHPFHPGGYDPVPAKRLEGTGAAGMAVHPAHPHRHV